MAVYAGDKPAYFERAFASSVDEQQLKPTEVVLVQDGPVSAELKSAIGATVESSSVPVNWVVIEKNVGLAEALTIGLAECLNDVVARMDSDDISMPERFARQLPLIERGYDLVGSGMYEFEEESGVVGTRIPPTGSEKIARYANFHDPFNHPTVVYRRSAVVSAGAYQDLSLMEDYWLFVRMIKSGARVENIPEPLLKYRVDSGAYVRRGGSRLFASELKLQREMRDAGFITRLQYLRNVAVRGGYRFVPVGLRQRAYRRFIAHGFRNKRPL
jgi:glycosyltransferase involved in cell wall biosynthesis